MLLNNLTPFLAKSLLFCLVLLNRFLKSKPFRILTRKKHFWTLRNWIGFDLILFFFFFKLHSFSASMLNLFFHSNFLIWMENVVGCTNLQYYFVTSKIYLQESYFSFWTTSLFLCRSRVFVYDPLQQRIFMELQEEDTRNKQY